MEDGEFYIKDFYIKKDYTIKDGDLHYGEGFMDFHDKLLDRFRSDSKGLVLFHGTPGTGKTFYIRSLIKDLLQMGRYIIYLPPGMVDSMVDPGMLNFLSSAVMEKAEEGKSCILLLEDAEPLLASRKTENRSAGITNLLNVTDGLLNDMLSIQVIATFNTELSNIDEALLRPERLIARKEFKKLKKEDAILLAKSLGVDRNVEDDMTLAEIYSQSKSNEVLVHEYNNKRRSIGFK
jgi:SpoVK/Ycf46/Vps4 family AAA+-type ATPase